MIVDPSHLALISFLMVLESRFLGAALASAAAGLPGDRVSQQCQCHPDRVG